MSSPSGIRTDRGEPLEEREPPAAIRTIAVLAAARRLQLPHELEGAQVDTVAKSATVIGRIVGAEVDRAEVTEDNWMTEDHVLGIGMPPLRQVLQLLRRCPAVVA